ncbi:MAG: tyrosine-protein phosphatase [Leadbetterella sp.]
MKKFITILTVTLVMTLFDRSLYAQDTAIVFHPKRMVSMQGTSNFRDLGGYPTQSGKYVKWNKIFRSADISALTDHDLTVMQGLNISHICDFRGPDEIKTKPDRYPSGIVYVNLPAGSENVNPNANYARMNRDSMMISFYSRTDHLKAKYKPMFDQLLELKEEQSLLFHCTAGKDRTGMGAALILSALGVSSDYIIADYTATNRYWENSHMQEKMIKSGIPAKNVKAMMSADPNYIKVFFDSINAKYGSMDKFLKNEMELSKDKIKALRMMFLTKNSV